jgi:hypothetical protein
VPRRSRSVRVIDALQLARLVGNEMVNRTTVGRTAKRRALR